MKRNLLKKLTLFDTVNGLILCLISVIMLYPLLNVIAVTFSSYEGYVNNPMMIVPHGFTLESLKTVLKDKSIMAGYKNTLFITTLGVSFHVLMTIITAYPLSKKDLWGKPVIMMYIIITMMFSGGMIPTYFLIRDLDLLDSLWSLILPGMAGAANIILMKNSFEQLPEALIEAAKIDGAGEVRVLFQIVIPISKAIIATIVLFSAVAYWNTYFNALLYISTKSKWPLQLVLNEIIKNAETSAADLRGNLAEATLESVPTQGIKYATLLVVIIPILCVYPFLQKHFATGITVGSVKG